QVAQDLLVGEAAGVLDVALHAATLVLEVGAVDEVLGAHLLQLGAEGLDHFFQRKVFGGRLGGGAGRLFGGHRSRGSGVARSALSGDPPSGFKASPRASAVAWTTGMTRS